MVQRWAQAVKYPWVLEKAEGEKKKKKKKVKNLNRKVARAVNWKVSKWYGWRMTWQTPSHPTSVSLSLSLYCSAFMFPLGSCRQQAIRQGFAGKIRNKCCVLVFFISCSILEQCQCIFIKAPQSLLLFLSITEDKSGLIAALYVWSIQIYLNTFWCCKLMIKKLGNAKRRLFGEIFWILGCSQVKQGAWLAIQNCQQVSIRLAKTVY